MAITLGSVSLPDGAMWTDRTALGAVAIATKRRFDGGLVIRAQGLSGGRVVTLTIPEDVTITRGAQLALEALAAVPGAAYSLEIPRQGFSAMVMITALELQPLFPDYDPIDEDLVFGSIQLLTV